MPSLPTNPEQPRVRWLFLDLNSYFASVEQELTPSLRGRPVAVVPVVADTTCCIAASYEAKAYGVKTGTPVAEARQRCPGITFVEGRHELYVKFHDRIVKAVQSIIPVSSVLSIDEMACRLMGREQPLLAAIALAQQVKAEIRDTVGSTLRCSIGLAPNRYLAKVASDMEKPDGLVALTPDLLETALLRLELRALPGIGARMEARLHRAGIYTMEHLWKLNREQMSEVWGGIGGEKLWHWLRGEDFHDDRLEHNKSISHSHVLAPELRTRDGAYAVVNKLVHKAAMRLRTARLWATGMRLSVKFVAPKDEATRHHNSGIPQIGWSQSLGLVECQDNQTLNEGLRKLWKAIPEGRNYQRPFYVGVALDELVPDHLHTLDLFGGLETEVRRTALARTMDSINQKHGTTMLFYASMLPAGTAAPTRIAFTSIPDLF